MACRINRQRIWAFRLELEARLHFATTVVTLTYADAPPQLVPRDATLWLKRIRRALEPGQLRFFLVGEYGTQTFRPHYHAILFGLPLPANHSPLLGALCRCETCNLVRETWSKGRISCDSFSVGAARYVCGYVTKKLTQKSNPALEGRHPEFTRMSRRPGIGRDAVPEILQTIRELQHQAGIAYLLDVPSALRSAGQMKPLGRFLVQKLRLADGRSPKTPPEILELRARELQDVSATLGTAEAFSQKTATVRQGAAQITAKHRLFNPEGSL